MKVWGRVSFVLIDLASVLTFSGLYLSRSIYAESLLSFMQDEVLSFSIKTSQFEIWITAIVRFLILSLLTPILPTFIALVLFIISVLYIVIKAAIYEFSGNTMEYVVMVGAAFFSAAEMVYWSLFLRFRRERERGKDLRRPSELRRQQIEKEEKEPLNSAYKHSTKSAASTDSYFLSINGDDDDEGSNYSESDFFSADEIDVDQLEEPLSPNNHASATSSSTDATFYSMSDDEMGMLLELEQLFPEVPREKIRRFMVARKMNFENTRIMLENHREWRKVNKVDEIDLNICPMPVRGFSCFPDNNAEGVSRDFSVIFNHNGMSLHKHAYSGQPLVIYPIGYSNAKGTAINSSKEVVEKIAITVAEFFGRVIFPELQQRTGKPVPSVTAVMDLNGLGIRQFYMPAIFLFTGMVKLNEDNYPETLGMVCVINAPSIFQMFWNLIKPLLTERTLSKIRFLGEDYREEMLKVIPPENLPFWLGGLCCCRCEGGCVPWTKTPGYENPNQTADGFHKISQSKDTFSLPVAITEFEFTQKTKQTPTFSFTYTFRTRQTVDLKIFFLPSFDPSFSLLGAQPIGENLSSPEQEKRGRVEVGRPGLYVLSWTNREQGRFSGGLQLEFKLAE